MTKVFCALLLVACYGVASLLATTTTSTTPAPSTTSPPASTAAPVKASTAAAAKASTAAPAKASGGATTARAKISDEALEAALGDKRYLSRQIKCALGEGACDPVGRRLRTLAPLVLRGACPQCTPQESRQIKRTLSHIQRNYPKEWAKIVKQYAGLQ